MFASDKRRDWIPYRTAATANDDERQRTPEIWPRRGGMSLGSVLWRCLLVTLVLFPWPFPLVLSWSLVVPMIRIIIVTVDLAWRGSGTAWEHNCAQLRLRADEMAVLMRLTDLSSPPTTKNWVKQLLFPSTDVFCYCPQRVVCDFLIFGHPLMTRIMIIIHAGFIFHLLTHPPCAEWLAR